MAAWASLKEFQIKISTRSKSRQPIQLVRWAVRVIGRGISKRRSGLPKLSWRNISNICLLTGRMLQGRVLQQLLCRWHSPGKKRGGCWCAPKLPQPPRGEGGRIVHRTKQSDARSLDFDPPLTGQSLHMKSITSNSLLKQSRSRTAF